MLVSYNWLKEYVDIPWGPQELADRLTMAGLEVEGVERLGPDLKEVYVGRVETVKPHPNADQLTVCSVSVGELGTHSIVCGAPNVEQGQTVAVALPGAVLPGGFRIKETTIRDVASSGMLCSEKELGIGDAESGILVLPEELEVGQSLVEALGLDDMILDVSIYANRPDCMSMLGVAREVAAIAGTQIRYPAIDHVETDAHITELTSVHVENSKKCPRYTAKLLDNINIGPSPLWMQMRLRAAGMRPINNVVDITNYVMLELGQPLHAFDFHRFKENRIVVRTAKPGETIVTLDGETRVLNSSMLVICDAENPKCIAGIMGGEDSEVTAETTTILLESANFEPVSIRRTSRSLGLSSESAARFEKGIDPHGTEFAAHRAAHLLESIAGAKVYSGTIDKSVVDDRKQEIELCPRRVNDLLGVKVPKDDMITILKSLGFEVEPFPSNESLHQTLC
jgi:phenylalanyl-tRNA synthetase beta chain